jgi:hypothetical protein
MRAPTISTLLVHVPMLVLASLASAQSGQIRTGAEALADWKADGPGVRRLIKPSDLPPPLERTDAERSIASNAEVIEPPSGALPKVPDGFAVHVFATGFKQPRTLRVAPNGDIFLSESGAGRVLVFRAGAGGAPAKAEVFAENLDRPYGIVFQPPPIPDMSTWRRRTRWSARLRNCSAWRCSRAPTTCSAWSTSATTSAPTCPPTSWPAFKTAGSTAALVLPRTQRRSGSEREAARSQGEGPRARGIVTGALLRPERGVLRSRRLPGRVPRRRVRRPARLPQPARPDGLQGDPGAHEGRPPDRRVRRLHDPASWWTTVVSGAARPDWRSPATARCW